MGTHAAWKVSECVAVVKEKERECKDVCDGLAACGPRGSWGHTYPWGCMGGRLSSDVQRAAAAGVVVVVVAATGSVANRTAAIERP